MSHHVTIHAQGQTFREITIDFGTGAVWALVTSEHTAIQVYKHTSNQRSVCIAKPTEFRAVTNDELVKIALETIARAQKHIAF